MEKSIAKTFFFSAMKKTCIYPIIVFLYLTVITAVNISYGYERDHWLWYDYTYELPFYLHQVLNVLLIAVALINAVRVFDFTLSKAKSNIIFSLGAKRSTIFLASIFGGILPTVLAFVLPAALEIASGYLVPSYITIQPDYIRAVLLFVLFNICTYSFAYTVFSAVTACSDNHISAFLFSPVILMLPTSILQFMHTIYSYCIPGTSESNVAFLFTDANWGMPYLQKTFYASIVSNQYILSTNIDELSEAIELSGIIFCAVYAVIALVFGAVAFSKRKAENIGTWGKSRLLTEICAVITGINLINLFPFYLIESKLNQPVFTFVILLICFAVGYLVFKLIFNKAGKKNILRSFKRLAIYAVALALCFCVTATGFFGIAIPKLSVDEISMIQLRSPFFDYTEQHIYYSSFLGLQSQGLPHESKYAQVTFTQTDEISTVFEIYNSLSDEISKIKATDSANCYAEFIIHLNNGRQIKKSFAIASDESITDLLRLNDLKLFKDNLAEKFDKPEETGGGYSSYTDRLMEDPAYLFSTDMTFAKKIGTGDKKLLEALKKDLVDQSVQEKFFHTADDELGVIVFGLPSEYSGFIDYDEIEDNSTGLSSSFSSSYYYNDYSDDGYDYEVEEYIPPEEFDGLEKSSWSIHRTNRYIVITKDMKNTVAYLKEHGLDKYLENTRDVHTIKSVKLATRNELSDAIALPIFSAAYWSADMVQDGHKELQKYDHHEYLFGKIDDIITDKDEIARLVSESVIFGYCASDSRIMEITYEDGSVATVMVSDSQ
ncbi:MAG: ABC transporter permease [Clostridia bacterium]|nr:ABC transporter permease [Clostridia bacterium]